AAVETVPSSDGSPHRIVVTPEPNFTGSFPLVVEVCDENERCSTESLTIEVTPTNDAPEIAFGRLSVEQGNTARMDINNINGGSAVTDGVLPIYVRDVDGDVVRLVAIEEVVAGVATSTDRSITFTHDATSAERPALTAVFSDGTVTIRRRIELDVIITNVAPRLSPTTMTIAENTGTGAVIGTVVAADDDGDPITYSLDPASSNITINPLTGDLVTAANLNHEAKATYVVNVTATDPDGMSATAKITVNVSDVDEPTSFGALPVLSISEDASPGTPIGTFVASDPDGSPITFSATTGGPFAVDPNTGVVTATSPPPPGSNTIVVTASTDDGDSVTVSVPLTVTDVNHAPVITAPAFTIFANETTAVGTVLGNMAATDSDGDSVTYAIVGGDSPTLITIDPTSGSITLAEPIDYETKTLHSVVVQATDSGSPAMSAMKEIRVGVLDANEAPILDPLPVLALPEVSTTVGTTIATASASDPEGTPITFSGIDPTGTFSVAPDGSITVGSVLDFETSPSIPVTVIATDADGISTNVTVTITISDENELPVFDTPFAVVTPPEGTAPGTVMGSASATDPDPADIITYRIISGDPTSNFAIDPATGEITLTATGALDYETTATYTLTLGADDGTAESTTDFKVSVINVDEPPTISGPAALADQNENTVGPIETIVATDPEGDSFTFAIDSGDPGGVFAITPTTGLLSIVGVLDYETTTLHPLVIRVTQDSDATKTMTVALDLNVLPLNEPPVFDTPNANVFPLEGTVGGVIIGSASATDPDAAATITYRIISGDPGGDLTIDPATGDISTAAATVLDLDVTPVYPLVIGADDGTVESTTSFTVTVDDVDEAPAFTGPAALTDRLENQAPGLLDTFTAADPESDTYSFTIDSGDPGGLFSLDPATGDLTLVGALDFETTTSHSLVIRVAQDTDPTLFTTATFTVTVLPVDEAPAIAPVPPTFTLAESATDPTVGTITATDQESELLTYSISDPRFTIDGSGVISAVDTDVFDYETLPTLISMIVAVVDTADPIALSDTQAITVQITNTNEAPVVTAGQSYTVVEDDPNAPISATPVATTDVDSGDSIVSYAITGGSGATRFTIDGAGIISKAGPLDFNAVQSYVVEVTVTDASGLTGVENVTIDIESRFGPTPSPFAGQVIINEVMYRNGGTPDWIELVNVTGAPIDASGWTISDAEAGGGSFNYFGPTAPLAPGDHVVFQEPGVEFAWIDDVFIRDDAGLIVAYMAWGDDSDGSSEIVSQPPLAVWPLWDSTYQIELGGTPGWTSISLSPDAGTARDSACWEVTTTGTSVGRCTGAKVTLDTILGETSSWGDPNTTSSTLVISELAVDGMYSGGDFIEIYNASSSPQPLAGIDVELVHAGGSDTIDLGAIAASLAPGQHILLAEDGSVLDPVADALLFSATIDPEFGVRILDTGSGLVLDEVGNAEDLGAGWAAAAFREGVGLPNPIGTGGFELSFERKSGFGAGNCVDTEDNAADFLRNFATGAVNPESFADPVVVCGTHVVPGPADHIVLSEFRTNGPNGGGDEFIEVFNPHSSPIDVSSTKVFANGSEEYAFPAVSLQPGEHWLIAGGNFLGPRDGVYGGIANGTSSIELWDGATLVDQILIDSGPGSVPKTSDTDSGTVQRANNGCADYAQPDFNYLWGGAPTPRTSGPTYAPC
ncbi:MAG: hypothetical protein HKN94_01620, partial [Acidimicrobiales bacterium]|nr:hypothetical protein [Acidimicrobiales bacterium]